MGIAALGALAVLACAPGAPASGAADGSAAGRDTLRGTVEVVGSEPGTSVVLQVAADRYVTLLGERPLLLRLSGLEVMVRGELEAPRRFRVERVTVRASAGVPAEDGILAREGERWFLLTGDGRRLAIARVPEALRNRVGARVFLAGPLDRAPDSFGIIEENP